MHRNLLQLELFNGIPVEVIEKLIHRLPEKTFKTGELLIEHGSPAVKMFLLLEGKVDIYYLSQEGIKTTLHYKEGPAIAGQIELFNGQPYLANVEALEPCNTIVLTRHDFMNLIHKNHQVCINLSRILSLLLCETGINRKVKFFGRVENNLANILCHHAKLYGEEHSYGTLLKKELNKQALAESLGVARQSVVAAFKKLEKRGLILVDGKQVLIPNVNALQTMAQDV